MHHHRVYGLDIRSTWALPGVPEGGDGGDVAVIEGAVPRHLPLPNWDGPWFEVRDDEVLVRIAGAGRMRVRRERIVVRPELDVSPERIGWHVLSTGLAAALLMHGRFVLHASAVRLSDGRTVAFMGPRQAGKSTIAGAFHRAGAAVISDDVAALHLADGTVMLSAGYPALRLEPSALRALGDRPDQHVRIDLAERERYRVVTPAGFDSEPTTLDAVYLLAPGDSVTVERCERRYALADVLANRHRPSLVASPGQQRTSLELAAAVVRSVPVFRLRRPRDLDRLDEVVRRVVDTAPDINPQPAMARH